MISTAPLRFPKRCVEKHWNLGHELEVLLTQMHDAINL